MPDEPIRIRGVVSAVPRADLAVGEIEIKTPRRVRPGASRDADAPAVQVAADELVRIELDNGFVLWSRADDLAAEHGRQIIGRDGAAAIDLSSLQPGRLAPQAARAERGAVGLGIKVLDFFGVDLKGRTAAKLAEAYEQHKLKNAEGIYHCSLEDQFTLTRLEGEQSTRIDGGPVLVFIHGTGSSSAGGFGGLWRAGNIEGRNARRQLHARYGDRVLAFEHFTLSKSPIQNALELAKALPKHAELHLVSHSRGGLVGELLALGECADLRSILAREKLAELFAADRTMGEQLGLAPLDAEERGTRDQKYEEDRDCLATLVDVLLDQQFKIRRFVRVACPALGTTLASGRLDRWLSVLSFIAGKVDTVGVASDVLDFLLAVVKERTDPRTLPGLEAQMPGSALTRLLHDPDLKTASDLCAIAGDIEGGDSLWAKVKLLGADWFFGADHDLVVNTGSMLGGLAREKGGARHRVDRGETVSHSAYFVNPQSVRWLVAGLTDQAGFAPITPADQQPPRWRGAVQASRDATESRPLAVVLPGTMGSHLHAGGDHIWLRYFALLRGGLRKLRIGESNVEPRMLLDDFYGPLLEFLAGTHRVEYFAYDWRRSVRDAADKLAAKLEEWLPRAERDGKPVHIVAHSMGGLVVRAMIGDADRGAQVWKRIVSLPNSRFLMLGTPNAGSYEAVRWLTGFNPTQAKIALLDFTQTTDELATLASTYPGLLELLPFGPDEPDFLARDFWEELKKRTGANWSPPAEKALSAARSTLEFLREQPADPRYMCYVAGSQPATVVDYELTGYRKPSPHKRIEFQGTAQGDGTVLWKSALWKSKSGDLANLPTWYVADTAHDALCAQRSAFAGYLDLLTTGKTTRLPAAPPAGTRDAAGQPARFAMPQSPPADSIPRDVDARLLGFGGGSIEEPDDRPAAAMIDVSIRHGSLAYVRHPVMVGHYTGDTIVSAEAFLDRQLGGELSRRLELGEYPGPLNTEAIFIRREAKVKPAGAIVMGLGDVGDLTPSLLEQGVCSALLNYALQIAQWPDDRFGKAGTVRSAAVSCCLIGTGAGQLQVRGSIEGILRGAIKANERLAGTGTLVAIDRLEFIEIYEDVALAALAALRRVLGTGDFAKTVRWRVPALEPGSGGQRRIRQEEAQEWWQRLEIIEDKQRADELRFTLIGDRARTEESLARGQLALADPYIRRSSSSPVRNDEISRTLFEMLLPQRLKENAPRQRDMVLLLDETSARFPWELLEDRWSDSDRPPSVRAGLLRQLKSATYRARPEHGAALKALVIGHPDLEGWTRFPDLPGAREEAKRVVEVLTERGYDVTDCIDQNGDNVLGSLHRDAWRVLHFAAHGVHEFTLTKEDLQSDSSSAGKADGASQTATTTKKRQDAGTGRVVSGMVIGKGTVLTPGDIGQMRWVPELVFINCCHLGRTQNDHLKDRSELAANLGVEFIRMGARAVIAAGWAVDDAAALAFAETFYGRMLDGDVFGAAVKTAREFVWRRFPSANTWGAYQCYGDPNYRLKRDGEGGRAGAAGFGSPNELITALNNLAASLDVSDRGVDGDAQVRDELDAMQAAIPAGVRDEWLKLAEVCAAFGFVYGELRDWTKAIEWLDKAIAAKGSCPIKAVEQSANFKVRSAMDEWQRARDQLGSAPPGVIDQARAPLVLRIQEAIRELDILCTRGPNVERLALLGSACKRLAMVFDNGAQRNEALLNMANYYRQAFALKKEDAYALTNWATAQLLLLRLDPSASRDWQTGLNTDVDRLFDLFVQRYDDEPDFWNGTGIADLQLVQLLDRCLAAMPPLPDAWCADGDQRIATIRNSYFQPVRRGASSRKVSSITENLDFVVAMLDSNAARLRDKLTAVRAELMR